LERLAAFADFFALPFEALLFFRGLSSEIAFLVDAVGGRP
jgi:hypothetical protein